MGLYSAITFGHIAPLLGGTAAGVALEPAALEAVQGAESPVNVLLRANWARQVEGGTPKPSLLRALKQTFWRELLHAALCKLCWGALIVTCASFFVRYLLSWVRQPSPDFAGWVVAASFFVACVTLSVALQQTNALSSRMGSRVGAALASMIYEKSLREDRHASPQPIDVVSLVATDCTKLQEAGASINYLWSAAVEALAIFAVLIGLIGRSALPGLGLILLVIPAQYALGITVAKLRKSITEAADARVARMDEILRAIKLVKCYAWEGPFSRMVAEYRSREVALLKWSGVIKSFNLALVFSLPPLIALSIFGVHSIESDLASDRGVMAFTTLSLFNTLRLPLVILPKCLRSFAEAVAALKRVEAYLLAPEREERPHHDATEIVMTKASYSYGGPEALPLLKDVTLSVAAGQLAMVFGPVGSGKSNLVNAILGRMRLTGGTEAVGGRFAYVPQKPWCQHGTVRDNIVFGAPWDEARYRRVLFACALEHDLAIMADGDATMLGERGLNVSGGQAQRLALARAAYSDADTFLLDSPLSAVDMYTSQHIFKHCIRGLLRGRTVVLVTHQVELLPEADVVVVMDKGAFTYCGPYTRDVGVRLGAEKAAAQELASTDAAVESVVASVAAAASAAAAAAATAATGGGPASLSSSPGSSMPPSPAHRGARAGSHGEAFGGAHELVRTPSAASMGRTATLSAATPSSAMVAAPLARERALTLRATILGSAAASAGETVAVDDVTAAATPGGPPPLLAHHLRTASTADVLRKASFRSRAPSTASGGGDGGSVGEGGVGGSKRNLALLTASSTIGGVPLKRTPSSSTNTAGAAVGPDPHVNIKIGTPAGPVDPLRPARPAPAVATVNGYTALIQEAGVLLTVISLAIFGVTQATRIASDAWISVWVGGTGTRTEEYYLGVYGGYVGAFIILLLIRGLFFYWIFRGAATRLHNLMFARVIRAPLSYFTNTPVGRILSVFSKDQDTIDEALLDAIHMTIIYTAILCTTAGVVIRVVPYFAAIVGALLVVFVYYFRVYMRASASIKALAGTTTSLLLAHVSETLSGMAVIHAFRAQQRFVDDNRRRLVNMHLATRTMDDLQGWLSFRLDFVASLLVLGTCLLMVGLQASVPAAGAGLAISNSFQILLFLSLAVKGAAEIHANMPAVERVVQLTKVEEEPNLPLTHESCPAESWPAHGAVSFHGVVMSYARDTPAVLKGVDFSVEPGEKVGIVGRTGAGKSSLVMALFRLAEMSKGEVRIDGVNTKVLNLTELRRRIAIVPQEPVLFNGSLRDNLDPFGTHTDDELLTALRQVHLAEFVTTNGGLDMAITATSGSYSLSLGQAQLVSLARAVLNPSPLLILDEATSALDLETDRLVQQTIRSVFASRTVLCVAHRLDTIIDSDKILCMSEGRVAEFESPLSLLQRDSIFRGLCAQTGTQYESLLAAAEQHQRTMDALEAEAAHEVEDGTALEVLLPEQLNFGGSGGDDAGEGGDYVTLAVPNGPTPPPLPSRAGVPSASLPQLDTVMEADDAAAEDTIGRGMGAHVALHVRQTLLALGGSASGEAGTGAAAPAPAAAGGSAPGADKGSTGTSSAETDPAV